MTITDTPTIEDLCDILSNEAEAYRQVVALTLNERAALRESNLAEFIAAILDKEAVLELLAHWNQARGEIVACLAETLRLPAGASLSDLIAHLDEASSPTQGLIAVCQELICLIDQILRLNHGNRLLIQAELARIEGMFDYLAHTTVSPDGGYTASGRNHV